MILRDIKRKIILSTIVIILTVALIGRISYATFTVSESSERTTIQFGDIDLELCYSSDCNSETQMLGNIIGTQTTNGITSYIPQFPIADSAYTSVTPYKFVVTNTGDLDLYLSLYLEPDLTAVGGTTTESRTLPNNMAITGNGVTGTNSSYTQTYSSFVSSNQYKYFKVAIIEEGTDSPLVKTYDTIVSDDNKIVGNISLSSGDSKTYLLYMWLSNDVLTSLGSSENTNLVLGKFLVTDIYAKGEYKPETE